MLERIVCATDFGEASRSAVRLAASLSRATGASIDLVHAWNVSGELPRERASLRQEVVAASREAGHTRLEAAVAELAAEGVKAVPALIEGIPDRAIREYAATRQASVIVVGTRADARVAHALIGSVAERLMRSSEVPVLVVPQGLAMAAGARFAPGEILVPTDLSPGSGEVLRMALSLAAQVGARVVLLHAWDVPPYFLEDGEALRRTEKRIPEHVAAWLEETFDDSLSGVERSVVRGSPHEVIADAVRTRRPGLVMMATAGRAGLERFMLGSVTERAVRTLGCPVLTIRRVPV
ncbi:MAG: universal stress protein [Sandaracinus sp.]